MVTSMANAAPSQPWRLFELCQESRTSQTTSPHRFVLHSGPQLYNQQRSGSYFWSVFPSDFRRRTGYPLLSRGLASRSADACAVASPDEPTHRAKRYVPPRVSLAFSVLLREPRKAFVRNTVEEIPGVARPLRRGDGGRGGVANATSVRINEAASVGRPYYIS